MTENIFGSANYMGEDFAIDMSLVSRIEIVRGPSSALYGSNGIFATINVITRAPDDDRGTEAHIETGTLGERKLTLTKAMSLPRQTSLLISTSLFNSTGQKDIYFPEYDSPETNNGHAINMDGQRGCRFFADLTKGRWQVMGAAASREKIQPISWGDAVFNDRGTRATDKRAFVESVYTHEWDSGRVLRWRTYYDQYRYRGEYRYPLDGGDIDVNREADSGDWVGTQVSYRFPWLRGDMTLGSEAKFDLRALQFVEDVSPVPVVRLNVDKRDKFAAGFLQQEWDAGKHWSFNVGLRFDASAYRSRSFAPRLAVVYQPDTRTALKLVYGRGFRNPNANELFFSDGSQSLGNPNLRPEQADSLEFVTERRLGKSWKAAVSLYEIRDRNIIVPTYTADGLTTFENNQQFHGQGAGVEISGRPFPYLDVSANFQKQTAYLGDRSRLANSPGDVGSARFAVPLWDSKLSLTGGLLYESERRTLAGARLEPVILPEVTLTTSRLVRRVDVQIGVRNRSNAAYSDPAGLTPTIDAIRQPGRTFFFRLSTRFE